LLLLLHDLLKKFQKFIDNDNYNHLHNRLHQYKGLNVRTVRANNSKTVCHFYSIKYHVNHSCIITLRVFLFAK